MNKVVLITGATGGIGSATAELFSEEGWHIIGVDKNRPKNLINIDHFICGNVSDPLASKLIFEEISREEMSINALINNAAIQICKPFIDTTLEEWDNIMISNVRSVYLTTRNAYHLMRSQGGAIVNISSVHALATSSNIAAYAASKGALLALTRALAIELASYNIRVNAVLPGAVDTQMLRSGLNRGHLDDKCLPDMINQLGLRHIMGRIGRPEEIAHAIYFLANNEESSFITGQSIVVDGGVMAMLSSENNFR